MNHRSLPLATLALSSFGLLVGGCAGESTSSASSDAIAAARVMSTQQEEEAGSAMATSPEATQGELDENGSYRVLVTGFNDWKELGDPPNVWRCRDNPSCRLLLGDATVDEPERVEGGALIERLHAIGSGPEGRPIEWTFATMPVTWQVSEGVELADQDLVIHLGLGVYDRFDRLMLERGAYNQRRGADAVGQARDEKIDAKLGEVKHPPADSGIDAVLDGLDGKHFAGYELVVAAARPDNSYLCNETHFRALTQLEDAKASGARLQRVHFLHIPYAEHDDYTKLADGVAEVIGALVAGDKAPVHG